MADKGGLFLQGVGTAYQPRFKISESSIGISTSKLAILAYCIGDVRNIGNIISILNGIFCIWYLKSDAIYVIYLGISQYLKPCCQQIIS